MKKGVKVWGLIVVLMLLCSIFSGVVSAENVSVDLTENVAVVSGQNNSISQSTGSLFIDVNAFL